MDPLKIIFFLAAFVALLLLGRLLSGMGEVHAASLPHPSPEPGGAAQFNSSPVDSQPSEGPAVIGADIAFPIRIPPVIQGNDGAYNRPNIVNYYFSKTDLLRGPEDPDFLFDELYIEAQDPGTGSLIYYSFTVATPSGLRRAMDQEKLASLYLDHAPVVIVPRWDLPLILHTVIDEIMKVYGGDRGEQRPQKHNQQ
jgi:hypothetical protein